MRCAFKMKLKPGCEVEYEKRHRAIWPELVKLLKETGVSEYSIFWDKETNLLFAVQEQAGDSGSQDLGTNPVVKKWWDYMADIMERQSRQFAGVDSPEGGFLYEIGNIPVSAG